MQRVRLGDAYARVSSVEGTPGPTYVLVPGIGIAATSFERLAPRLSAAGRVVALDLPGFAGVPRRGDAVSIAHYAEHVEHVLDVLGIERPVLIGHSMGAQVVVEVAARRPEIDHVVLIGPVVDPAERRIPVILWRFALSSVHEPITVSVLAVSSYLITGPSTFFRVLPHLMHYEIERRIADVEARVLVVCGGRDAVAPIEWGRRLRARARHGRAWEVEGAAHSVMHEFADGVARLCIAHVEDELAPEGVLDEGVARSPEPPRDRSLMLAAVRARGAELAAVLRRDDRALERAKTRRMQLSRRAGDAWH